MFRHASHEASRLDLEVGVNLSTGWVMGGPWIKPEYSGRWVLQSTLSVVELQKLFGQFAADAGRPLKITSAPGNWMFAVRILHARSLSPNRSAFPEAKQVTLLVLENATTFYFLDELGSPGILTSTARSRAHGS